MPRFQVIEKRALYNGVLIDADDESAARKYEGEIVSEAETDTWGDELISVEQVDDDREDVDLP